MRAQSIVDSFASKSALQGGGVPNFDPFFFLGQLRGGGDKANAPLTSPYTQHPWVYTAVKAISRTIAAVPWKIWKDQDFKKSGTRKTFHKKMNRLEDFTSLSDTKQTTLEQTSPARVKAINLLRAKCMAKGGITEQEFNQMEKLAGFDEVKAGEIVDLFDQPNSEMVAFEFWEATITYLISKGACLWVLRDKKDERSLPKSIEAYGPNGWTPKIDKKGKIVGWEWEYHTVGGEPQKETFKGHEVIWFKNFNPENFIKPLPWYQPALLSVQQDHEAMIYNKMFFKNGAETGVVLESEQVLTLKHKRGIISSWEERHKGSRNGHKMAVLDGGLKAKIIRSNHRDMEFRLLRETSRDEILAAHNTPKAIAGIIEDVNRATFLGSKKTFFEVALIPIMEMISHVVYSRLIRPLDPTLFGFFDIALVEGLRGDVKEKAEVAKMYHDMGVPFNALNRRFDLGFSDIEFGEFGFIEGFTVEQIVAGEKLSIGDNQLSPDSEVKPPKEEDDKKKPKQPKKPKKMSKSEYQDLFVINEQIVGKRLNEFIRKEGVFDPSITQGITKLVVDSVLAKQKNHVYAKSDYKDWLEVDGVSCALATQIQKKQADSSITEGEISAVVSKLARLITTKLVNSVKFKTAIRNRMTLKTWLLGKSCENNQEHVNYAKDGKSISILAKFGNKLNYPGDFSNMEKHHYNCQCSITVE